MSFFVLQVAGRAARRALPAAMMLAVCLLPGCSQRPSPAELGEVTTQAPKVDTYPGDYPLPELESAGAPPGANAPAH